MSNKVVTYLLMSILVLLSMSALYIYGFKDLSLKGHLSYFFVPLALALFISEGIQKAFARLVFIIPLGLLVGFVSNSAPFVKYIFLFFLIAYGTFLYFRCGKELSNSVKGQGICLKRAFNKLATKLNSLSK